jgi:hypothetical protein
VRLALYDLEEADIGEKNELSNRNPSVVRRLNDLAEECREDLGGSLANREGRNCKEPGRV